MRCNHKTPKGNIMSTFFLIVQGALFGYLVDISYPISEGWTGLAFIAANAVCTVFYGAVKKSEG